MIDLIVLDGGKPATLAHQLSSLLSSHLSPSKRPGAGESSSWFRLAERFPPTDPAAHRLIFCQHVAPDTAPDLLDPGKESIGVLSADDLPAAALLNQWGIPAITCGMSVKDTLTLSSLTSDSAVICLQRTVPTFTGEALEPGEFPVRLSHPASAYPLMCAAATLLLSGQSNRLNNGLL